MKALLARGKRTPALRAPARPFSPVMDRRVRVVRSTLKQVSHRRTEANDPQNRDLGCGRGVALCAVDLGHSDWRSGWPASSVGAGELPARSPPDERRLDRCRARTRRGKRRCTSGSAVKVMEADASTVPLRHQSAERSGVRRTIVYSSARRGRRQWVPRFHRRLARSFSFMSSASARRKIFRVEFSDSASASVPTSQLSAK